MQFQQASASELTKRRVSLSLKFPVLDFTDRIVVVDHVLQCTSADRPALDLCWTSSHRTPRWTSWRRRGSSADWNLCQPDFATDRPPPASRELASSSQFRTMTCPFSTKMVITTVFILTDFKIHSIMADLSSSPSWLVDCFEQLTDDVRMSMSCTSKRWWILSITLCEHASAIAL